MKALVGAFNQEKALVGAFSVIVKTSPMFRLQLYSPQCRVSKCPPGPPPGDCCVPHTDTEFTRGPVSLHGARSHSRGIYCVRSVDSIGIVYSVDILYLLGVSSIISKYL